MAISAGQKARLFQHQGHDSRAAPGAASVEELAQLKHIALGVTSVANPEARAGPFVVEDDAAQGGGLRLGLGQAVHREEELEAVSSRGSGGVLICTRSA
jgi:hypothetical protein